MPESITFPQYSSPSSSSPSSSSLSSSSTTSSQPNYEELARFLIEPLLDSPESLSIHCEIARSNQRVLIRVAFAEEEQGRVFGRGGRNIDAIRATLEAAAIASGQSARLEIFGVRENSREFNSYDRNNNGSRFQNENDEDGDRRGFKKPSIPRPSIPSRRPSFRRRRSSGESRGNWRPGNSDW
ncbi:MULTISPECIES: KH domain-containing protein [Spirulina sp. CCY15215]|uniref:KH domain-containing protein n=1 Tax=Spirulina sp. CCY15215 TaxID=2767591 RepID=UPI00194F141E|nr:KH domain-containing protein [Spirulina major]